MTTSANLEPRLKQNIEIINGETAVHRLNQLNHDFAMKPSNGEGNWTFMVYLDADIDLERNYINTFLDISSVGSTSQVNIVVQMDRISGYDSRFGDWTDCKRFYITKDLVPTAGNAIQNLTEVNMGDPDTLTDFVTWAINSFSADSYCLVLVDHGSGYINGVCLDETNGGDWLSLPDLSQALSAVPEKMDVVYFDACVMGMIEVAYQIRNYADIMIASEEVSYTGPPYEYYLANLTANPSMSASELADVIVSNYIEDIIAYSLSTGDLLQSTMSAVDLSQILSLKTAVDNLAQRLNDSESIYNNEIRLARGQAEGYEGPYSNRYGWYMDLYHFAQLIYQYIPDTDIRNDANQVMALLSNAVIVEDHYLHPNSHGLSIFFPCKTTVQYRYDDYVDDYLTTDFANDTMWDEFIDYHVNVTPAVPDFVVVDVYWEPSNPMPGDLVTFYADLANQGTEDESGVDASVYIDGQSHANYTLYPFEAGYSCIKKAYPHWTATEGKHNITWIIDKYDSFDEWDETNNEMTKNFTVCALTVQTPYRNIQVWIDGDEYTTDYYGDVQTYIDPGFHSVEVPDFVSLGTSSRGAFVQWDDGNLSNPRDIFVENSSTLTATYATQYSVTFEQSGSSRSPHVTVDGTEYQLPCLLWMDEDSSHTFSYESPVSGGTGVQHIIDYASYTSPFTVYYERTVTGYYTTQFWLQVTTSVSGVTVTGTGWHDSGTSVTCNAPTASGYTFDHWTIDGTSQQKGLNSITVTMNEPHEVTAQYVVESITGSGGGSGGSSGGGGGSGAGSSADFVKPSIGEAAHQPHEPDGPMPSENVKVSVDVTDDLSGVAQVILHYRTGTSGHWIEVDMSQLSGNTYVGEIPSFGSGTKVYYYVTAYDNAGNRAEQDNAGEYYTYSVIPEFSDFIIVGLFMLLTLVAAALAKIRHKAMSRKTYNLTCKSNLKTSCCH